MLGIDPGCSDMAWQMNPMRKAFLSNAPQIFFAVYVMPYVPNTYFFNIVHLSAIVRHVKCTFLYCFYTHLQLVRAICVLIFISTYFLSAHVSDRTWVKCYGMADEVPSPMGRHFIDMVQKIIFCSMYTSVSPQKHFFNIMNFVGIASHIKCTFLSDYPIHFHVCMLISVYILIFLHIFCLGMLGIDHG